MNRYIEVCRELYSVTHIPLELMSADCVVHGTWPVSMENINTPELRNLVLTDYRIQGRDCRHPLISYLEPGFFLGVFQPEPEAFITVGMVPPFQHTMKEIMTMGAGIIPPEKLQNYCSCLLQTPIYSLEQVGNVISVLARLTQGEPIPREDILFNDFSADWRQVELLDSETFRQREEPDFHVPTDYETGLCQAVEQGSRELLTARMYAPYGGRVGRMSSSPLRQEKYSFICLATLISRAAIRGGLSPETSFSLSDIYCQRVDVLSEAELIQKLTVTMLGDYCDRVAEARKKDANSPVIQKCLDYISVHLHETVKLDDLSSHCGLCTRSLSLRFKDELGMGIPEYINREKTREAQYMLLHTDYTLSDITAILGYPSQSYFTQNFKKYCGKTPQQYRDTGGK